MKETITGLQKALDNKGIKIELGPKTATREETLIRANEIDLKINVIEVEISELYRKERKIYYSRLKLSQSIGQLQRARRVLLGFDEPQNFKQIDDEIKKSLGVKDET